MNFITNKATLTIFFSVVILLIIYTVIPGETPTIQEEEDSGLSREETERFMREIGYVQ